MARKAISTARWSIPALATLILGGFWLSQSALTQQARCNRLWLNPDPRTPISSLPFTIDQCGSYFLTDCLMGTSGQNGITITTDDVTLDLNGFSLIGTPGSLDGVSVPNPQKNVTITGGIIQGWDDGINAPTTNNADLFRLDLSDLTGNGIILGSGCRIDGCTVENASGPFSNGILVQDACVIQNCTILVNSQDGIQTNVGCVIQGCTTFANGQDGIDAQDSLVNGCTSRGNGGNNYQLNGSSTQVNSH